MGGPRCASAMSVPRSSSALDRSSSRASRKAQASGEITIGETGNESKPWICDVGIQIADGLHPVANPAVDAEGNIFVHLQRVPRAENSGFGLQDRPELPIEAIRHGPDERYRTRIRPRRNSLHFQPQ